MITGSARIAEFEGHEIHVINKVDFYCLSSSNYDTLFSDLDGSQQQADHPCKNLIKLLSCGSFYYSYTFDLSRDLRTRASESSRNMLDCQNLDFIWNHGIISELQRIKRELSSDDEEDVNSNSLLVSIMQGFVGFQTVSLEGRQWKVAIISRLSSNRAGTRFNARGIDDDGNVSNFVETEFLIFNQTFITSFLQLRGSIPCKLI